MVYEAGSGRFVTLAQCWRRGRRRELPAPFASFARWREEALCSGRPAFYEHFPAYLALPFQANGCPLGLLELVGPDLKRLAVFPRLSSLVSLLELSLHLHRLQEEIAHRQQEAEALRAVAQEILHLPDLKDILRSVTKRVRSLLGADMAALCLLRGGEWSLAAFCGPPAALKPLEKRRVDAARVEPQQCASDCLFFWPQQLAVSMAVPLQAQGRVIGALCIGHRRPRPLPPWQQDLLAGLAAQAAIAIEHLGLQQRVQELARWEERERIGHDLHDGVIQSLYAIGLALEGCVEALEGPEGVRQRLEEVIDHLNEVIADIRSYIFELQPQALRGRSLAQALTALAREYQVGRPLAISVKVEPCLDGAIAPWPAQHLFHIAQEALANAVKHSGASAITLRLTRAPQSLILEVQDNGRGFNPQEVGRGLGEGLRNMADRAQALGGRLELKSEPGKGTIVSLEVPLRSVVRRRV